MEPRIPKYVAAGNAIVKFFASRGVKTGPVNVLTVAGRKSGQPRSTPVTPWLVDGKRYVIAAIGSSDWARNARAGGEGTLASGRHNSRVRLTEITDPELKKRVVTDFGTKNKAGGFFLTQAGVAPDRTPAGFAAAAAHAAVFEVTAA
jgi:deazaflavin-dependent oxidoreductase (nitroreductase family)